MPISALVATVAQVRCFKQGSQLCTASGFFYLHGDRVYFITNRHVVVKEADDYFPDEMRLSLHTDPNNLRQNEVVPLSLYDSGGRRLWIEHPKGKRIDVVAVPLDTKQVKSHFFIQPFGISKHIPQDVDVAIGEDVLVIGYPLGFHDEVHNLPIVRSAVLASVYPVPFQGDPIVLIDARLHRGTSGSPVITKPTQMIRRTNGRTSITAGAVTYLVGVHSATIDVKGRDSSRDEPLGLNVVWFASLIPEIISQEAS